MYINFAKIMHMSKFSCKWYKNDSFFMQTFCIYFSKILDALCITFLYENIEKNLNYPKSRRFPNSWLSAKNSKFLTFFFFTLRNLNNENTSKFFGKYSWKLEFYGKKRVILIPRIWKVAFPGIRGWISVFIFFILYFTSHKINWPVKRPFYKFC